MTDYSNVTFGAVTIQFNNVTQNVSYSVVLENLELLWAIFGDELGNVTLSHMHVQENSTSGHLAFFAGSNTDTLNIALPKNGTFLLAYVEIPIVDILLNVNATSFTSGTLSTINSTTLYADILEYFVLQQQNLFADIHTTHYQPPNDLLKGIFQWRGNGTIGK